MSQQTCRETRTLASRWGFSVGVSVIAATAGFAQTATAQVNPQQLVAQTSISIDAEVVSPRDSAERFGTEIPVVPPSDLLQPRSNETRLDFPRLSLSDILVLEPNLDPEKARPVYRRSTPRIRGEGFKVMVEAKNAAQEERVRSLVPQAFRTIYNGQTMLQVGLFRDRANAEEVRQSLNSNGLRAIIVSL